MPAQVTYDGDELSTRIYRERVEKLMPGILDAARSDEGHLKRVHWRFRDDVPGSPDARRLDADEYALKELGGRAALAPPTPTTDSGSSVEVYLIDDRAGLGWTYVQNPMLDWEIPSAFYRLYGSMLAAVSRAIVRGFDATQPVEVGQ